MKLLLVSNMYPSSRYPVYGNFVKEQVESLQTHGYDFSLAVNTVKEGTRWEKIKKYASLFFRAFSQGLKKDIELVHIHYAFPTGLLVFPMKWLGKKVIITAHGSDVIGAKGRKANILRRIFSSADAVVGVSDYLRNEIISLGVPSEKVHSINCGVNRELFVPLGKEKAKRNKGLDPSKQYILYLGRLTKEKGFHTFIDFAKQYPSSQVEFIIVGDGPLEEEAKRELSFLKERCHFYNAVPKEEVPAWFQAADVYVFPTKKEAFGLVSLESISCHTPVVASHIGGVPETVVDGKTGFLFPAEDTSSLISSVQRCLQTTFSSKDFEEIAKQNEIESQIQKVISLYESLKGGKQS